MTQLFPNASPPGGIRLDSTSRWKFVLIGIMVAINLITIARSTTLAMYQKALARSRNLCLRTIYSHCAM